MIEQLAQFHFIRPLWLLLAPVVVGVWWLWRQRSDPLCGWREQIAPELLRALVVGQNAAQRGPALWLLLAWLLAVIAVAGPTWRPEPSPFADDASPLMILLKADISMDTADPLPSRLARAHLKIADLAAARKGQPLGLIAYAGSAHLVLPPTRDTAVVASMAAEIGPAIMPLAGDRLDLALQSATEILTQGAAGGTIVVIADAFAGDPASLAPRAGSPVHFLAIGIPRTAEFESLRAAARTLKASVQMLSVDDEDVTTLVRLAARTPLTRAGEQGTRWEEAGYWLVPVIGLIFVASWRRQAAPQASAHRASA